MNISIKFLHFFLFLWVIFALVPNADPDPDPDDQNQCGSIRIQTHNASHNVTFYVVTTQIDDSRMFLWSIEK